MDQIIGKSLTKTGLIYGGKVKWIDAYCRANTDKSIAEASAELVVHLEKQGQASE
jgi:hypothetical protein